MGAIISRCYSTFLNSLEKGILTHMGFSSPWKGRPVSCHLAAVLPLQPVCSVPVCCSLDCCSILRQGQFLSHMHLAPPGPSQFLLFSIILCCLLCTSLTGGVRQGTSGQFCSCCRKNPRLLRLASSRGRRPACHLFLCFGARLLKFSQATLCRG